MLVNFGDYEDKKMRVVMQLLLIGSRKILESEMGVFSGAEIAVCMLFEVRLHRVINF